MNEYQNEIVFGPVPSRRLGKSLGINNIPPKICTYSCVYCQLGRTYHLQIQREAFYEPDEIVRQTKRRIQKNKEKQESIDYLTFVPDGEPTLDENLGEIIQKLKMLHYPIAVITNASLIYREDVRRDLQNADWVSVKIDAVDEHTWKTIDRGHGGIHLKEILEGITEFSKHFSGTLVTETMLIKDINDSADQLSQIASFIETIHPKTSYLSIPIRPPAESWVKPATEQTLTQAYQLFTDRHIHTEYLIGYEGNEFAFTGNIEQDILSITAVHPMRQDAVDHLLKKAGKDFTVVETLIKDGKIVKHTLNNDVFYMRKLSKR